MHSSRVELAAIVKLAAPIVVAQFGLMLLGLVDVAILGRADPADLGGASVGRSIGFVSVALGIGVTGALEPLAAQAIGAGEPAVAWSAFRATLRAVAILWIPCAALAFGSTWLLGPLGVEASLVAPARAFLGAQVPGLLFFPVFLAAKTYLQAHDRTLPALLGAVVANVVNVVVCAALVLGDEALVAVRLPRLGLPRMGAFGAGIANSVANAVLALVLLAFAWRTGRTHRLPAEGAGGVTTGKVLRLGTPVGLQLVAEIGVFSLVAVLAGKLGTVAVSAHQIAISLASFTFMGVLGISGATAVRVGVAVGEARSPRAAGLIGIGVGAAFMTLSGVVFVVVPRGLVGLFTTNAAIVDLGASLVVIAAAFQLFDGIQGVAAGALRGAGDVRFSFLANVAGHWLVGFPLAITFCFVLGHGARGLWWGLLVGLAVVAVALAWRFVVVTRGRITRV